MPTLSINGVKEMVTQIKYGLDASKGSAASGVVYYATDTDKFYIGNGSNWREIPYMTALDSIDAIADADSLIVSDATDGSSKKAALTQLATWLQGGTALGYKEYVAKISQSGTNAPTAVVIANTLGETPTFTRDSTGTYTLDVNASLFSDANKVALWFGGTENLSYGRLIPTVETATSLYLYTYNTSNVLADGLLSGATLIVRVYD